MIKTILIEDEINVREALRKMLMILNPNIDIVAETGYVVDAVKLIEQLKPDLVFMDIELEDGSSFEILKKLKTVDFKIIFTTAYNQYAIKAFKYSTVDYLLKPLDPTELQEAIFRAESDINNEREHKELLNILKNNIDNKDPKIVLKTTEQRYIVSVKDIIRLEADGAYTLFICVDNKIIVSKNIKYYQEMLGDDFIRTHQSHLVNIKHITGLHKSGAVQLSNDEMIPIATRKKSTISQLIADM